MAGGTLHPNVAIVGTGLVGSSFAYTLMVRGLTREIGLIDANADRAEGEAMDLRHGLSFASPMLIRAGGYDLCGDADIVVITAGASQAPGESRLDLVRKNSGIMRSIVRSILKHNPNPFLVVVANPVDALTHVALRESGLPPARVIGSGTVLDSARFRYLLSEHCGIDPRSIHASIIGEHGDSEVAAWSRVNVAGVPLRDFCPACGRSCDREALDGIVRQVREAAYEIIAKKGATYYAIGLALARIVEAITRDQRSVLTVSGLVQGQYGIEDVCLSLPAVIGSDGLGQVVSAALAEDEAEALRRSAAVLRETLKSIGF